MSFDVVVPLIYSTSVLFVYIIIVFINIFKLTFNFTSGFSDFAMCFWQFY